jgi:uroporphyrinogen decarboxylase
VLVDVDTVTLAGAIGVPVDAPDDEPARVRGGMLRDLEEAEVLPQVNIARYPGIAVWLEATRLLKKYFGNEIAVRGNCDQAPFSLAAMVRGMDAWMMDLLDPGRLEQAQRLLEYCTDVSVQFLRLMAATGADILSNGDSPAGPDVVSPVLYRKFAFPWEKKVVEESHRLGLPYVLHICGKTDPILEDMLRTGADGLDLDYKTDARLAYTAMNHRAVFIGNIDPSGILALGSAEEVREETEKLLATFSGTTKFVLNSGCAIPATAPSANLQAMISTARGWHSGRPLHSGRNP